MSIAGLKFMLEDIIRAVGLMLVFEGIMHAAGFVVIVFLALS